MNREILNDNNMRTMYKVQKMPVRITVKMNSNKYESNNRLKKDKQDEDQEAVAGRE